MIEINKNNSYINVFDNINEVNQYITTRHHKDGRDNSSQDKGDADWYGTNSFEEATNKLIHGDEDLYNRINDEIKKLNLDKMLGNVSNKLKYEHRTYGCIPNIPAYLTNNPLNMINPEKTELSHKVLNIFLNIRVGCGTDGEKVVKIGSKYLAVIDLLEKAGYRCNLYSGVANGKYGDKCLLMVKVKTDREPFNLKKICFTIANPAMQRRIKFRWMEVNDGKDFTNSGYGSTCDSDDIKKMLELTRQDYIVWNYERNNSAFKIEDIIKELEEQGIKIG